MDPSCILMCANIPRGIPEDALAELFCIAGPIEDVAISRSGRTCFIVYQFPEAVPTAKEIFKDVKMYGRPLEMFDENDIKQIHLNQEQESFANQLQQAAYAEVGKQYNPFYNAECMTPTSRNSRGRPQNYPAQHQFDPSQNYYMPPPVHFTPPNQFMHPPNQFMHPPNQFMHPPNQFMHPPNQFMHPPNQFMPPPPNQFMPPPPNNFNGAQNQAYGENYDPSNQSRRWNSTPEVNPSQSPNTGEPDPFRSPYSQPVSRKNYEQSRKNYQDGGASNSRNRSFGNSKRYSDEYSSSDSSKKLPVHKKFKDDDDLNEEVHLFKDTSAENDYEGHTRRHNNSSRNSYRKNDRYNNDSRYGSASGGSDYRNKSRDSHSRNADKQQFDQRESRKSKHYHGKDSRNHRR